MVGFPKEIVCRAAANCARHYEEGIGFGTDDKIANLRESSYVGSYSMVGPVKEASSKRKGGDVPGRKYNRRKIDPTSLVNGVLRPVYALSRLRR